MDSIYRIYQTATLSDHRTSSMFSALSANRSDTLFSITVRLIAKKTVDSRWIDAFLQYRAIFLILESYDRGNHNDKIDFTRAMQLVASIFCGHSSRIGLEMAINEINIMC